LFITGASSTSQPDRPGLPSSSRSARTKPSERSSGEPQPGWTDPVGGRAIRTLLRVLDIGSAAPNVRLWARSKAMSRGHATPDRAPDCGLVALRHPRLAGLDGWRPPPLRRRCCAQPHAVIRTILWAHPSHRRLARAFTIRQSGDVSVPVAAGASGVSSFGPNAARMRSAGPSPHAASTTTRPWRIASAASTCWDRARESRGRSDCSGQRISTHFSARAKPPYDRRTK
jgi:hypothetical protein